MPSSSDPRSVDRLAAGIGASGGEHAASVRPVPCRRARWLVAIACAAAAVGVGGASARSPAAEAWPSDPKPPYAVTAAASASSPTAVAGAAPTPVQPTAMQPVQVSARAWFVQGRSALGSPANRNFISNAGFVVTDDSVVVIDALGSPALAQELLDQIRRITDKPVSHVMLTHYHADHVYGLQSLKRAGATIVAHRAGLDYLNSDTARLRLEASRRELAPWIDADTRLVPADRWIDGPTRLEIGGVAFEIVPVGPSHTPDDLAIHLPGERVLFSGDLVFRGRIPFVGQADSRHWIAALDRLLAFDALIVVPGHGPHSTRPGEDMTLTRDYLVHLRRAMGDAARNLEPFDDAYRAADWSRFEDVPLFGTVNRMNAYNTYLLMEQERD